MKRPPFYIVLPGEGESLDLGEAIVAFKATGEDTADAFTLCECELATGSAPLALPSGAEAAQAYTGLYVLAGEVCLTVGVDRVRIRAGGFALLRSDAAGTVEAVTTDHNPQTARVLCLGAASALEHHFTRLANQLLRPPGAGVAGL